MAALTRAPAPAGLRRLGLSWNGIGDEGAAALAGWPGLAKVIDLRLVQNGLTSAGLRALLASPYLRELRWLFRLCSVRSEKATEDNHQRSSTCCQVR